MIILKDIHKHFGRVRANDGISVTLEPGRIYALVGENGAGKSTLMRVLAGHTRPDSGTMDICGQARTHLTPTQARDCGVGMLYQDPLDFPALPIWENFRLGGRRRARKKVLDVLGVLSNRLGACYMPDEDVSSLTVGERQMLELLRLLDLGARTLILDEPTTGITPEQKRDLFDLLLALAREEQHTVVLVTHKLAEAYEMADRILVMRQGKLVAELDPPYNEDVLVRHMFGEDAVSGEDTPPDAAPDAAPCLTLESAVFSGPKYALPPLSLTARPGEIIGMAGLDGSGQEVFLRGLCGLDRMPEGSISACTAPAGSNDFVRLRRAGVHFVPADRMGLALFPDLTVREHISLTFPEQAGRIDEFYRERCVGRFDLRAAPEAKAKSLSGGNQQRLLLSLMPDDVGLLLMEHPTRGLDAGSARQVWEHLRERCADGACLFYFSPDLDEVLAHSHRILVFYNHALAADIPRAMASVEVLGALMAGKPYAEVLGASMATQAATKRGHAHA